MFWFIFALMTAFFESLKDVFSKKTLGSVDEYIVAWSLRFFSLPFLLPLLIFVEIPPIGERFFLALIVGGCLNVLATILYMKAIKESDLSLSVPMIAFTPMFLLVTSPLILGEFPNMSGFFGIVLIVAGSYVLNIGERHKGFLAPFGALLRERGPKFMIAVAFIWSISSNFDKIGVQNSSPVFWVIAMNVFIAGIMLPIMIYKSGKNVHEIGRKLYFLVPIGLFSAVALVFQMTAVSIALVSYVISIKRTSAIMTVVLGHFIFREKGLRERLLGAAIMVAGVVLIALS